MKVYIRWRVTCEYETLNNNGAKFQHYNFREKKQALRKYFESIERDNMLTVSLAYYEQCCDGQELMYSDRIVKEWELYPDEIDNSHLFR